MTIFVNFLEIFSILLSSETYRGLLKNESTALPTVANKGK